MVASNPEPIVAIAQPTIDGGANRPFLDTNIPAIKENMAFPAMYGIMLTPEVTAEVPLMAWNHTGR